ncbi:flippase [Lactobacillus ultunensis]|uniref:Polysaccharide biosynthesis protein n=1 Tax=Lactobacillus ultunensis DSM 16047 TaxID=525365 RepID=C2EPL5_9LACO|nr:flippase [Lactobacillus ultunensis]EEJ71591.1 polysaccharide biosynthesis protein [Lactobacillus ultunensis DSM 16047]KRL82359.1 O-antigen teichoic acid transporter [Lactobacillus ultunensis DSM 16047]QQP28314.1 flippase [Lactobacillus ultunensis]
MLKSIKNKLKSKTVNNGIWMYLLQLFNTVIPLVTLPYVTRILGTSKYGVFSASFNLVSYLQVIVEYGFAMSATREIAIKRNKKNINKLFSTILYARLLLLAACIIFSIIYLYFWHPDFIQILSYWMLMIMLLATTIQENWLFQGLEDMKYIAITNIIARTITMILIFCYVKGIDDLLIYCYLYAIAPLISNLLGLGIAKRKYNISFVKVNYTEIFSELKNGWYIFTTQFTSKVFGAIGVTFLTFFDTSSTVGIFSAIQKIPNTLILMWNPISTILFPVVSKKMKISFLQGKKFVLKVRKRLLVLFLIPTIIFSLFSYQIVKIAFGINYATKSYWLIPLLLWLFVSIDNNFWGVQILLGSGHDKQYSLCFMISVVATIIFNLIFIKIWGGSGAAWAPLASELLLDILLIRSVKKIEVVND